MYRPELSSDQTEDDKRSLVFDSEKLSEEVQVLGTPVVTLCLESSSAAAFVAVRLCDVLPSGGIY